MSGSIVYISSLTAPQKSLPTIPIKFTLFTPETTPNNPYQGGVGYSDLVDALILTLPLTQRGGPAGRSVLIGTDRAPTLPFHYQRVVVLEVPLIQDGGLAGRSVLIGRNGPPTVPPTIPKGRRPPEDTIIVFKNYY